jgi:hypothetical protein
VSAIGILGGLAAAGAAYKEGKRNREREARQKKYDDLSTELTMARLEQVRGGSKPKTVTPDAGPELLNSVTDESPQLLNSVPEEKMAYGGVVGYANGGYVGNVMDCSDSSWQRQSFKK